MCWPPSGRFIKPPSPWVRSSSTAAKRWQEGGRERARPGALLSPPGTCRRRNGRWRFRHEDGLAASGALDLLASQLRLRLEVLPAAGAPEGNDRSCCGVGRLPFGRGWRAEAV